MPKKFDTNPLDPDFPRKVKEAQTQSLPNKNAETRKFDETVPTEEQTRRFDEANFSSYSSPYDGQQIPNVFKTAKLNADVGNSSKRKVDKVGLPENILVALPYLPFYIGLIAGILELLFVPKSETKVRFHAAQGLAAHIGILLITTILGGVGNITDFADLGNAIFQVVTTVMLIIFAVKAWQGKPVHIESVDNLTEWLDDKIKPRG
ncbi:MAG: hypothetical protein H0W58_01125 [Acidobacteria bacterium]|jgi:uncharacterized membrane protein|nr:hypothetical protein [Acidobacteriota bacterium]